MKSRTRLHVSATAHRLLPRHVVPHVVEAQLSVARHRPERMREARRQMTFLLERSGSPLDLEAAAVRYLRWEIWRRESRWHPSMFPAMRVRGLDQLLRAHERSGGVLMTSVHHGPYEGAVKSLVHAGGPRPHVLMAPRYFDDELPPRDKSFKRLIGASAHTHTASIGVRGIADLLRTGNIVSMATDMAGSVPLQFAGREVRGASGAAVAAMQAGVPVIPRVLERDRHGWFVSLHEPIDPSSYGTPQELMQALVSIQEPHILAHPEAYVFPTDRYRTATA